MDTIEQNNLLQENEQLKARLKFLEEQVERTERIWHETEMHLKRELQKADVLALSVDSNGKIQFCNDYFLQFTGTSKENVIGMDWNQAFVYNHKEQETPITAFIDKGGIVSRIKRKINSASGEVRNIRFNIILQNSSNGFVGATLIGEDVTDKKKIIKSLKEDSEQFQDLFENANDLFQVFSLDGRFFTGEPSLEGKAGYSDEEIDNLNFKDIIHEDFLQDTIDHLENIIQGNKADEQFETIFVSKSGKKINVIGGVNIRYENDKPIAFKRNLPRYHRKK